MTHFKRISVQEADQILAQNSDAILLDIRDQQTFIKGHHPRAIWFNDAVLRKIIKTKNKHTPVVVYCYHGNSSQDIAAMLVDFGLINCYSVDGGYSAWRMSGANEFPMSPELTLWLRKKGYDTKNIDSRLDEQNRTALMLSAKAGHTFWVKELINAGANPNLTDIRGNNALWYACMSQNIQCVHAILNGDGEVDNINSSGFSNLEYAIGMDDIYELLINGFNRIKRTNKTKFDTSAHDATQYFHASA